MIADRKKLVEFFLEFGAENNLDEAHVEKLERILHVLKPQSITAIKKICTYIVHREMQDLPEDEIVDALHEAGLAK